MNLFIAGLPKDFDEADLKENRSTGNSKGFGFITMPDKFEAMETIALFRNTKIKGKQIVVKEAEQQYRKN